MKQSAKFVTYFCKRTESAIAILLFTLTKSGAVKPPDSEMRNKAARQTKQQMGASLCGFGVHFYSYLNLAKAMCTC